MHCDRAAGLVPELNSNTSLSPLSLLFPKMASRVEVEGKQQMTLLNHDNIELCKSLY